MIKQVILVFMATLFIMLGVWRFEQHSWLALPNIFFFAFFFVLAVRSFSNRVNYSHGGGISHLSDKEFASTLRRERDKIR